MWKYTQFPRFSCSVSGKSVWVLATLPDLVKVKLGVATELLHVVHHLPPRVEDGPVGGEEEEDV